MIPPILIFFPICSGAEYMVLLFNGLKDRKTNQPARIFAIFNVLFAG